MKIHFWGVRGSIPAPLSSRQIQVKILAAVQRITQKDIESEDARDRFIASLPEWIFGTVGGNTPCIEVCGEDNTEIILDAGSGMRELGKKNGKPTDGVYNILFSHFHWDHIQGLPFFDPAYNQRNRLNFFSPYEKMELILQRQMQSPYFPVNMNSFTRNVSYTTLKCGTMFSIGNFQINTCRMSHPGASYAYAVIEKGKKFVYATDVELEQKDFLHTPERDPVFENADILLLDSQYTVEEAYKKEKWGHSAFCYAIDFAIAHNIKTLYLFHHEPNYDDKKIYSILQAARWYADYIARGSIQVHLALENTEVEL